MYHRVWSTFECVVNLSHTESEWLRWVSMVDRGPLLHETILQLSHIHSNLWTHTHTRTTEVATLFVATQQTAGAMMQVAPTQHMWQIHTITITMLICELEIHQFIGLARLTVQNSSVMVTYSATACDICDRWLAMNKSHPNPVLTKHLLYCATCICCCLVVLDQQAPSCRQVAK